MECRDLICGFCGSELHELYYDEVNNYYVCNVCDNNREIIECIRKYVKILV